jgi:hypothetical protein
MSDYNLYGLNSRTFQQMIQALAVQKLAPGIVVYGDGKDGARDASFQGKINYPSSVDQWDGYLIVQVKYRQKPFDDTGKAGQWVLEELEKDLKKFLNKPKNYKTPEYYILVTNIDLTPVPKVGTDALVREMLTKYAKSWG